jgi:signal transduction histidine kinase
MSTITPDTASMVSYPFLEGGGEMGELTRKFDWSKTSIGSPDQWPQSLRTILGVLLNSRYPMFLWWGPDLIQFYNDAYRPSLGNMGKHPTALGQHGEACWPEIWETIKPLIDKVLKDGEATWSENQLIPIYRNGHLENVYWTFGYSPVKDESGNIGGVLVVCNETTNQVLQHQKLEENKDKLAFAVEAAELATFDFNPLTNQFTANDRYTAWFGIPADEDVDNSLSIGVIAEADQERVMKALQHALDHSLNEKFDIEFTIEPPGKPSRILRGKGKAWFNEDNIAYRFTGTLQDVTAHVLFRNQLAENEAILQARVEERTTELASAIEDLKRSNIQLEEFAHAASHDLKEPIRKISFFTNRLKVQLAANLTENDQDVFDRIERASKRMNILIEDLLKYSEVSQVQLEQEEIDLNEKMRNILTDLELIIEEKQAEIEVQKLPTVKGYRRQLQQLFYNLLTNSLKYNLPGVPPKIVIKSEEVMGEEANLMPGKKYSKLSVTDNGIGFDQQYATKIFQMFQRLHGKTTYEGTGIGLAIARKVVENHNGKIVAESVPGHGATFTVYLPSEG